ncbi:MAG: hypothetical protein Q9222_006915 [Ikaeria aurantiellina]
MVIYPFGVLLCFALRATAIPYLRQSAFKATEDDDDGCPKGAYIIGIRGFPGDEADDVPRFGALKPIIDALMEKIPGSESVAINYPAKGITIGADEKPTYNMLDYWPSVYKGLNGLERALMDVPCLETPVVLLGYSQGAEVVGDGLCGMSNKFLPPKEPMDEYYTQTNDFLCDSGESVSVHKGYVDKYLDDIVKFVVDKVKEEPKEPESNRSTRLGKEAHHLSVDITFDK